MVYHNNVPRLVKACNASCSYYDNERSRKSEGLSNIYRRTWHGRATVKEQAHQSDHLRQAHHVTAISNGLRHDAYDDNLFNYCILDINPPQVFADTVLFIIGVIVEHRG